MNTSEIICHHVPKNAHLAVAESGDGAGGAGDGGCVVVVIVGVCGASVLRAPVPGVLTRGHTVARKHANASSGAWRCAPTPSQALPSLGGSER